MAHDTMPCCYCGGSGRRPIDASKQKIMDHIHLSGQATAADIPLRDAFDSLRRIRDDLQLLCQWGLLKKKGVKNPVYTLAEEQH